MKILIPIDFSKPSKIAFQYAVKFAEKLNAELFLLHVAHISGPPRASVSLKIKDLENAIVDAASQDCIQFIEESRKESRTRLNISWKVILGYPVEAAIRTFAHHNNISLIIMGTHGATGLKKFLLGSVASSVINFSDIPVITVPELARFKFIRNIVYATDMRRLKSEVKTLLPIAKIFSAKIHILHIVPISSKRKIDPLKISTDLQQKLNYSKISFRVGINEQIADGIAEFIIETKADILAMFTHDLSFFEKLFGRSITRQVAFQAWIPLLTAKKSGGIKK